MVNLVNTESGQLEQVPDEGTQSLLESGKYDLPKGQPVNVVNPDGKLVSLPSDDVYDAIKSGSYRFPSSSDTKEAQNESEYGDNAEAKLKAFGYGALRGPSFGLSDVALSKTGLVPEEELKQLKERHPYYSGAGELTGLGASILAAPAAAPAALLGKGAASVAGKVLGSSAVESVAGRLGAAGLGSAIEGLGYGAGQVVSDAALGDPDLNGQKALAIVGYSGLFGGALGGALGVVGETVSPKVETVISRIKGDVAKGDPAIAAGDLKATVDTLAIPEARKQSILEGISELKPNAKEIKEAADTIGAPVLEGQISNSKHVQDIDSMLMQSPTPVGVARQQLYQQGYDASEDAVASVLKTQNNYSKAEAGNAIKKGLIDSFEAETKPISDIYNDLKLKYKEVPLANDDISQISKNITNIEGIGLSKSSPEYKLAQTVSDEIAGLKTVDDVKAYKTIVGRWTKGNPELRYIGGKIQGELSKLEENSVFNFAKSQVNSPEESQRLIEAIGQRQMANEKYKDLIGKMGEIGDVIGKKRIYGPQDFIDFVDEITPEKLVDKLYAKNNSEFLQYFKEKFPKQLGILVDYQKNTLKNAALSDGGINANKILREVSKLSPEVKKVVFNEQELKQLEASQTYLEAMPKNINPSGTSKSEAYRRYFEHPIGQTIATVKDVGALAYLRSIVDTTGGAESGKINTLINMERKIQQTSQSISKTADKVFSPTLGPILKYEASKKAVDFINNKDEYKKVTNKIDTSFNNPEQLINELHEKTMPLYNHAPNVTASLNQAASVATGFLASKIPRGKQDSLPLSRPFEPSKADLAKFSRYYETIEDPVSAMRGIASGRVNPESLEALNAVYPKLYDEMKQRLMQSMTDKLSGKNPEPLPYKTKLGLSMFLGQDLDNSLDQQNIASNQVSLAKIAAKKEAQDQAMMGNVKSTQKGLSNITLSSRMNTYTQSNALRERS